MAVPHTPNNREAEMSVLAAVISDPTILDSVAAWIQTPEAFWYQKNKKLWQAVISLQNEKAPIDHLTVLSKCKQDYPSDSENWPMYISELNTPSTEINYVTYYAKLVREAHVQRLVNKSAAELQAASYESPQETNEMLENHMHIIHELQQFQPDRTVPFPKLIDRAVESIHTHGNILEFDMPALDAPAGGMTRGELTAIGGRPGHCKTTVSLNIVSKQLHQGRRVLVFNREMTNDQAGIKLLIIESGGRLSYTRVRKGKNLTIDELAIINETKAMMKEVYKDNLIMIDDLRDLDTSMREIRRYSPDVIIDDYIQLVKATNSSRRDRRFEIEEIMQEYKWIAKQTDAAGILISQLNRNIENRVDPYPRMSDYAESGVIEQIVENALFVFYGYNFDHEKYPSPNKLEILSAKTRYGRVGSYDIGYVGDHCKIYQSVEEASRYR